MSPKYMVLELQNDLQNDLETDLKTTSKMSLKSTSKRTTKRSTFWFFGKGGVFRDNYGIVSICGHTRSNVHV